MVRPRASTAVERRENPADSIEAATGAVAPVVARMPAGANAEAAGEAVAVGRAEVVRGVAGPSPRSPSSTKSRPDR